jgi:hypothetical protein
MKDLRRDHAACIDSAIQTMEQNRYTTTRLNVELGVKVTQIVIQRINDILKAYETTLTNGHALPQRPSHPVGNAGSGARIRERLDRRQPTPSRYSSPSRDNLQNTQGLYSQKRPQFGIVMSNVRDASPIHRGGLSPESISTPPTHLEHYLPEVGMENNFPLYSEALVGMSSQPSKCPIHMQRPNSFADPSARDSAIDLNPGRLSTASNGPIASPYSTWCQAQYGDTIGIMQQQHNDIPQQDAGMDDIGGYIHNIDGNLSPGGMYPNLNRNGRYGGT